MDIENQLIFRYKFDSAFVSDLFVFSKIHQYDHRKDFKEAWDVWVANNEELVSSEVRRLTNLGYNDDIIDKMFKSARYYYRKKSTEKRPPAQRRKYVAVDKDLLTAIDTHIKTGLGRENYKPASGFVDFCNNNVELLKTEVASLKKAGFVNHTDMKNKMKKTYKNRYFLLKNK
jgi:hypothetical protein